MTLRDRRERLFVAMDDDDLDILILSRPAEVRFAVGAPSLGNDEASLVAPICIAVRATWETHVTPGADAGALAAIEGLPDAARIGTTSASPGFAQIIRSVAPGADIVDGALVVWRARAANTDVEVGLIRDALAMAEEAMRSTVASLKPAATEDDLHTSHTEGHIVGDVARLTARASIDDYEASFTRSFTLRGDPSSRPNDAGITACRPGTTGAQLHELGVTAEGVPDAAELAAGMVVNVGTPSHRDLVVVGERPVILSNYEAL